MVKAVNTFLGCLLISASAFAGPTSLDCEAGSKFEGNLNELEKVASEVDECPAPRKDQFTDVCVDIIQRRESKRAENDFSYLYQEKLWEMSCAVPGKDTIEAAKSKIQTMWNKHRSDFRCYNYPESIASDSNITKFTLDIGFSGFLVEAVRKYKLDMNFKDPKDSKTVLDFVIEQEARIRNNPPVNLEKAEEYKRISKILETNGAKRGKDL